MPDTFYAPCTNIPSLFYTPFYDVINYNDIKSTTNRTPNNEKRLHFLLTFRLRDLFSLLSYNHMYIIPERSVVEDR